MQNICQRDCLCILLLTYQKIGFEVLHTIDCLSRIGRIREINARASDLVGEILSTTCEGREQYIGASLIRLSAGSVDRVTQRYVLLLGYR